MGIRDWFGSARPPEDREVREEIVFHLDRATQENITRGMGPEEARADALRRFGDLEQVRRNCLAARGRRVHPAIAWSAVAALAAVSFMSGYTARNGRVGTPGINVEFASGQRTALGPVTHRRLDVGVPLISDRSTPLLATWVRRDGAVEIEPSLLLANPLQQPAPSPFSAWRWRDGVPEVKLDGEGWYVLVSAAGIPAAILREEHRRSQGLPAGTYLDGDPHGMIFGNKGCKGPTVEVVLRSLDGGREVKVACAGRWVKVRRIPDSKWPKKEAK